MLLCEKLNGNARHSFGLNQFTSIDVPPLTLSLSPEYEGEGTIQVAGHQFSTRYVDLDQPSASASLMDAGLSTDPSLSTDVVTSAEIFSPKPPSIAGRDP